MVTFIVIMIGMVIFGLCGDFFEMLMNGDFSIH